MKQHISKGTQHASSRPRKPIPTPCLAVVFLPVTPAGPKSTLTFLACQVATSGQDQWPPASWGASVLLPPLPTTIHPFLPSALSKWTESYQAQLFKELLVHATIFQIRKDSKGPYFLKDQVPPSQKGLPSLCDLVYPDTPAFALLLDRLLTTAQRLTWPRSPSPAAASPPA